MNNITEKVSATQTSTSELSKSGSLAAWLHGAARNVARHSRREEILRAKREELVNKRDELVARQKMAEAQRQVQQSFQSIDVKDPTSDIARMEEKVRH